jgi:TIR domain
MFVFIAHAEADQAAADELKTFLKRRGLIAETETGERGFRYLQATDVVIGLWSQKSVFSTHRMQLERRMLDAWADAQLVMVKLDHSIIPVGLRDLPAIDASFEQARDLNGWSHTERAAREAINHALTKRTNGGAPPPGAPPPPAALKKVSKGGKASRASAAPGKTLGGSLALGVITVVLAAAVGAAWYYNWQVPGASPELASLVMIAGIVSHAGFAFALLSLLLHVFTTKETVRSAKAIASAHSRSVTAIRDELAPITVEAEEEEKRATAVFVSYSHADNAAVEPVVKAARDNGREVWIDKSGIQTGDGWAGEIVRAIRSAHGLMVMCSKHAFESDHVKRELYLADRYKKPMAPIFIEDAKPPEDFEYFFAGLQWLELYKVPEDQRRDAIGRALSAV